MNSITDVVASMHLDAYQPSVRGYASASIQEVGLAMHHARIRKPLSVDEFMTSFTPRRRISGHTLELSSKQTLKA